MSALAFRISSRTRVLIVRHTISVSTTWCEYEIESSEFRRRPAGRPAGGQTGGQAGRQAGRTSIHEFTRVFSASNLYSGAVIHGRQTQSQATDRVDQSVGARQRKREDRLSGRSHSARSSSSSPSLSSPSLRVRLVACSDCSDLASMPETASRSAASALDPSPIPELAPTRLGFAAVTCLLLLGLFATASAA